MLLPEMSDFSSHFFRFSEECESRFFNRVKQYIDSRLTTAFSEKLITFFFSSFSTIFWEKVGVRGGGGGDSTPFSEKIEQDLENLNRVKAPYLFIFLFVHHFAFLPPSLSLCGRIWTLV